MGSVAELCQGALLHAGELAAPESCSLSLVKKDRGGGRTLEEVAVLTMFGRMKDNHPCSQTHLGMVKGIMDYVLATGSPVNIDADQVNRLLQLSHPHDPALCSKLWDIHRALQMPCVKLRLSVHSRAQVEIVYLRIE